MFCCACNGSCNHVGPHSYCSAHGSTWTFPTTVTYTTNWPDNLSDEEIDRIADRVVEKLEKLLSTKKKRRK